MESRYLCRPRYPARYQYCTFRTANFAQWCWMDRAGCRSAAVPFKRPVYDSVLTEFSPLFLLPLSADSLAKQRANAGNQHLIPGRSQPSARAFQLLPRWQRRLSSAASSGQQNNLSPKRNISNTAIEIKRWTILPPYDRFPPHPAPGRPSGGACHPATHPERPSLPG